MKYNHEYEIKYQEVDGAKKLRLFNLENYLLEAAGTVADELGFGIAALHPRGLTWILTRRPKSAVRDMDREQLTYAEYP